MLGSYSSNLVPNWISDMFKRPWKFLGLMSSTVGLVYYALSPSFPRLYGEWNILKITLYVLVSLIISWIMLFAENLLDRTFLRLKPHDVLLVLVLNSSYSLFYDKTLDGKPDTLIVISNGAFALMSLSLSGRTELGFELAMSHFFLQCLTVQVMRINLMLTPAAAVFYFWVIVVRSHLDSPGQMEVDNVIGNDHLSIQIDEINRVAEGADIDMDTVRGAAGEGAEIEMDTAKRVEGEGAHNVSEIEESYATGTTEKILTDNAVEEAYGSVTLAPTTEKSKSKPFKRRNEPVIPFTGRSRLLMGKDSEARRTITIESAIEKSKSKPFKRKNDP